MLDPYLTLERVTALNPCHSADTIQAWYPGKKRVRLSTVLKDDRITHADRVWLAVRVLPRPVVDRWTDCFVERAIRRSLGTSGCPAWETWAARWLDGTDRTEARATLAALEAWAVAATWAARAAAWAARAAAAAEAAAAEVWAAEAAAAAAWEARATLAAEAAAAERDQQIADLLENIKTYKETDHA